MSCLSVAAWKHEMQPSSTMGAAFCKPDCESSPMNDRVLVDVDNHVATVTFNRADKRNAVDFEMFEGIALAASELAANPSVRAVVLNGVGIGEGARSHPLVPGDRCGAGH